MDKDCDEAVAQIVSKKYAERLYEYQHTNVFLPPYHSYAIVALRGGMGKYGRYGKADTDWY